MICSVVYIIGLVALDIVKGTMMGGNVRCIFKEWHRPSHYKSAWEPVRPTWTAELLE
ncbi:hypothetical protein PILCRDRAFT_464498 [Piloderma croceum F 1598]|uniref:Chromo domain-containing protein n=1 Tax=Piloderma croceum (strain F 1598) TaxID=765440 RepID=A0A0C3FUC0_PILCF|nr:hypothetical protein PILCRDRAFT_464498 [Piloderma croceum F 1598]